MTAAVAVPVKTPADSPDSTRPTSSSGTESATRNTTALTSANTIPASSTGRRPIGVRPAPERQQREQDAARIRREDDRRRQHLEVHPLAYSAYIGVGSVVPTMIAANA